MIMKKAKTISVVSVPVGKPATLKEISTDLKSLQSEVGGTMQCVYPFTDEVGLICNDEGKLLNLPLNRAIKYEGISGRNIYDIIAGDFFIAYCPMTSENFESMPYDLAEKYLKMFKYPEKFILKDSIVYICPEI